MHLKEVGMGSGELLVITELPFLQLEINKCVIIQDVQTY